LKKEFISMPLKSSHTCTSNQAQNFVPTLYISGTNAAGGSAGAAVTTVVLLPTNLHVSFQGGAAAYGVVVTPNQACYASVTGKSPGGFNVVLTPPSGVTLAAGNFDCFVIG
jgi:hypothetical protein